MIPLDLLIFVAALAAGVFGALAGMGGGLILVPLLTIALGVDIKAAIAVSLLGVIAVSATASASFLRAGVTDRRLGLTLLLATAIGGIGGGFMAGLLDATLLSGIFGVVLALVALQMLRSRSAVAPEVPVSELGRLEFDAAYFEPLTGRVRDYRVRRIGLGSLLSVFGGALSGLLGIGGGVVNVPTMTVLMGVPIRVATTTSTYMLGATAAASAVIHYSRGDIDPILAAPVVVGVTVGALAGARLSARTPPRTLLLVFVVVAAFFAVQMMWRAVGG